MSLALTDEEVRKLTLQDSRGLLSQFDQDKLEKEAAKNWDKFYNRNGNRFFKDRHWTTREFEELCGQKGKAVLLEIGCGVGNFFYPLLEDGVNFYIHACDFSPRAVDLVKQHNLYDPKEINVFVCDITKDSLSIPDESVDIVTLIFVLSAILPCHMVQVLSEVIRVLRPGGILLFRDYGLNDSAMIRFSPGSKLAERLYVRQDRTRAYYFDVSELQGLFENVGFKVLVNEFIFRKTINKKEGTEASRIFIQAKCQKPLVF